jgi:hypothetical protein
MHRKNFTVYHNPQNSALFVLHVEKRHEMMSVPYLAPAIGATGRLYSGKFRVVPASSSGQP